METYLWVPWREESMSGPLCRGRDQFWTRNGGAQARGPESSEGFGTGSLGWVPMGPFSNAVLAPVLMSLRLGTHSVLAFSSLPHV